MTQSTLRPKRAVAVLLWGVLQMFANRLSAAPVDVAQIADSLDAAHVATQRAERAIHAADFPSCRNAVREAKQHSRRIIGELSDLESRDDPFGRALVQVLKALNETLAQCESGQPNPPSTEKLQKVAEVLQRMRKRLKTPDGNS